MKDLGKKTMGFIDQSDENGPVVFVTKLKKAKIIDYVATLNGQGDRIHFLVMTLVLTLQTWSFSRTPATKMVSLGWNSRMVRRKITAQYFARKV